MASSSGAAAASSERSETMPVPIARGLGAPPSDSERRSAASRARRWGSGSESKAAGSTGARRSPSAVNDSRASVGAARHDSTRYPSSAASRDPLPPHRRLADAGISLEHERRKAVSSGSEHRIDCDQLGLAAEHRRGHGAQSTRSGDLLPGGRVPWARPPRGGGEHARPTPRGAPQRGLRCPLWFTG